MREVTYQLFDAWISGAKLEVAPLSTLPPLLVTSEDTTDSSTYEHTDRPKLAAALQLHLDNIRAETNFQFSDWDLFRRLAEVDDGFPNASSLSSITGETFCAMYKHIILPNIDELDLCPREALADVRFLPLSAEQFFTETSSCDVIHH